MRDAREASRIGGLFRLEVARSLAAQLAVAVAFVHSKGYVHGDVHFGNILFQFPSSSSSSINGLSISELYDKFGATEPEPVIVLSKNNNSDEEQHPPSCKGVPSHAIPAVWPGVRSEDITLGKATLLLSDFGVAFRPSDRSRFKSYTPSITRPPEAVFELDTPLSFASDIWSLGCVIFEILGHRSLIDMWCLGQDDVTADQVYLQGRMPDEWWNKWEKRSKWFDEEGRPIKEKAARDIWGWDEMFDQWVNEMRRDKRTVAGGMGVVGEEEGEAFIEMSKWMLAWRPEEGPRTEEVLKTDWMRRWGLPAYEESRRSMGL